MHTSPPIYAGVMHTGAHEEDLNAMSAIQSLVVCQQPPEKQVNQSLQYNEYLQDSREELGEQRVYEELQDQDTQESEQSPQERNSLPPTISYLPLLPQEFLKAPRAGPPNSVFTLDILVCAYHTTKVL